MSVTQGGNVQVTVRLTGENSASQVISQVNDSLGRLFERSNVETEAAGGLASRLAERWRSVSDSVGTAVAKFGLISQGVSAIRGVVDSVGDLVVEGAAAADQYDVLSRQLPGLEGLIDRVKRASGGMFSQAEVVKAVATFRSFGLDLKNIDGILAEVGKTAIRTGEDSAYLLQSITTGIARLSPAILDNLQLQVSIGQINEAASLSTGKATAELSKQEKQAAALNLVLGELRKNNAEVSIEEARTTRVKRLTSAFDDAWMSIKTGVADVAVGLYDFFDKTVFGASEAEREIAKMADTFPSVLGQMRGAAERDLPAIQRLFRTLQDEAKKTNELIGRVQDRGSEQQELEAALNTSIKSEQVAAKRRLEIVEANVRAGVFSEEQGANAVARIEKERDARIAERTAIDRQRWAEDIQRRREAEAAIAAIDEQADTAARHIADRERERNFSLGQIIEETTTQISKVEADLEVARARRDVEAVRRLQAQRVELRGYVEDLRDAEGAETSRSTSRARAAAEEYKLPSISQPRSQRTGRVRAAASDEAPLADLEARLANVEQQARATIDGLRGYQLDIQAVVHDAGTALSEEQLRALSDRWQQAQQRILDAEHALAEGRLDIAFETERRLTQIREDADRKRDDAAKKARDRDWEVAEAAVSATDQVASAFIKSEKARAAWNAGIAVLDAGLAFIRTGNPAVLIQGAALAIGYAARAGAGGGGGGAVGADRGAYRTASSSAFDRAAGNGPVNININAPWYGTPGELAAHLNGVQRVGGASGMRTGGVV